MNDIFYEGENNKQAFGDYGFDILDGGVSTVPYRVLVATQETEITVTNSADNQTTTLTLPLGFELYGQFTSTEVVSGKLIAYKTSI